MKGQFSKKRNRISYLTLFIFTLSILSYGCVLNTANSGRYYSGASETKETGLIVCDTNRRQYKGDNDLFTTDTLSDNLCSLENQNNNEYAKSALPALSVEPAELAVSGALTDDNQLSAASQHILKGGLGLKEGPLLFVDGNAGAKGVPATGKIETVRRRQDKLDEALRLCQQAQGEWEVGNPEIALETLDSAFELLLSVEPNGDMEIFQQKEDIRFLVSKRIIEIYASRQTKVNGKHREIPLVLNDYVQKEIDLLLKDECRYFKDAYVKAGKYRPLILEELKNAGLPERLSWLPLIESGFKTRALSRARALGLWQFIPSTGYKFGLERSRWIDERMDPLKSTRAAIEYLTQLHNIFGDWTTALAAYNCGEGTVLNLIRNQHINYLDNFWDLYAQLPSETARYVPKFMAALYLIENPEKYALELPEPDAPITYEEIIVDKQIKLSDLSGINDVSVKELKALNPELRYQITPAMEYRLKIPKGKGELVVAAIEKAPVWAPLMPDFVYHSVRSGQTLSYIAKKYRTSIKKIMEANNIKRANRLRIGQKLKIPARESNPTLWAGSDFSGGVKTYLVKSGDCAYDIAKTHNMSLKEFLSMNNLSSKSLIFPGQKVLVKLRR